mmetsp:Transcript_14803/g.28487  ORF Transcript_14803/g.28487 Transcript_14803/m.28487 type:complete len:213 (-) Transcript_14803:139-777(-)
MKACGGVGGGGGGALQLELQVLEHALLHRRALRLKAADAEISAAVIDGAHPSSAHDPPVPVFVPVELGQLHKLRQVRKVLKRHLEVHNEPVPGHAVVHLLGPEVLGDVHGGERGRELDVLEPGRACVQPFLLHLAAQNLGAHVVRHAELVALQSLQRHRDKSDGRDCERRAHAASQSFACSRVPRAEFLEMSRSAIRNAYARLNSFQFATCC